MFKLLYSYRTDFASLLIVMRITLILIKNILRIGNPCPISLTTFINSNCNIKCPHCWKEDLNTDKEISIDIIRNIAKSNTPIMIVAGGEPTIHPKFYEIQNILSKPYRKLYICTNAVNILSFSRLTSKRNIRFIISFSDSDSSSMITRKINFMEMAGKYNILCYANILHKPNKPKAEETTITLARKVNSSSYRIFISEYIFNKCLINKESLNKIFLISEKVSSELNREIFFSRIPSKVEYIFLNFVSNIFYREKYSKCSGYPIKAHMDWNEEYRNCEKLEKPVTFSLDRMKK